MLGEERLRHGLQEPRSSARWRPRRPKFTLTIGATRQGRLYAMTDQFPGDMFLIEKGMGEVLETLRDSWNNLLAAP